MVCVYVGVDVLQCPEEGMESLRDEVSGAWEPSDIDEICYFESLVCSFNYGAILADLVCNVYVGKLGGERNKLPNRTLIYLS